MNGLAVVKDQIPDSFCADVLCAALEGGIGYWAEADDIKRTERDAEGHWHYLSVVLTDAEGDDDWQHTIDYAAIRLGIERVLAPTFNLNSGTKGDILTALTEHPDDNTLDADGADAIVQAACFNDLVYG